MKQAWLFAAAMLVCLGAQGQMKGAGSSFAAPLYGGWGQSMAKTTQVRLDYESTGSSAGVKAAQDGSVDFGATDRPLSRAALDQAGLIQFPTAIGGVVVIINLPGIPTEKIKLDGTTLADLYSGRIKTWNAPALKALNPELNLPAIAVVPVFRSEGSGTSFVFTTYLSKLSAPFKTTFGATSNLVVPGGKGGKTSSDVAKLVRDSAGAIGYLDYANAIELGLPSVQLKNQWGRFIAAGPEALQLAMRAMNWEKLMIDQDPSFEMDLTDAGCPGCWPIVSATYVLIPVKGRTANSARVLEFFVHAIQQGDELAAKEGYVPLPTRAKNLVMLATRRWTATLEKSGASRPHRKAEEHRGPSLLASLEQVQR